MSMGELSVSKYASISKSPAMLAELARCRATKYDFFIISKVARKMGTSPDNVRQACMRHEETLQIVKDLSNENALLKLEVEALKDKKARIDGFFRPKANVCTDQVLGIDILTEGDIESIEAMQSLGLLEILE
jgi:hypothetical protein